MRRLIARLRQEQKGASAVPMAMAMTIVLLIAALVIDVGAMSARDAQLQDAADAAALAIAQQCYESPATNELNGCDPLVRAAASTIAIEFAQATLNDGSASLVGTPVFTLHTIAIRLASVQPALFSWAAGSGESSVGASATAQWNQGAVALPLAINACTLPVPSSNPVFVGTGLYNGVSDLLSSILSIPVVGPLLSGESRPDFLTNILDCGTNVLAGGWLATPNSDCTYDPNLITYLNSTINKVIPISECADVIRNLVGKRVILPVYENATGQLLGSALGSAPITRYAEMIVTGYQFQGLLGAGALVNYDLAASPSCARSAAEFLGVSGGALGTLLAIPVFGSLLNAVLGDVLLLATDCQGLQGQLVSSTLTPAEASAKLTPYRLIA